MTEVSHNFLCSLFLFVFDAKRCYARSFVTGNGKIGKYSKENYLNEMERVIRGFAPEPLIMSLRGELFPTEYNLSYKATS